MPNPIHSAGLWLGAALAPAAVCLGQSAAIVVDLNTAPARLIATKRSAAGEVVRTRPVCAYPEHAVYSGSGSTDDAASFVCR